MSKELVLAKLEELGFVWEAAGEFGYFFDFEDLHVLYMPDDDVNFIRFAAPNIYDVTEENKALVLELVNKTNMSIKYSKTCVWDEDVWVFYECKIYDENNLGDIIEHALLLLQATFCLFHRKLEGDDSLPNEDDETNNNEMKENTV